MLLSPLPGPTRSTILGNDLNDVGFRGAYADRFDSEGQPYGAPRIWKTSSADLKRVLTDPRLLREAPRSDGRMNISKAANAYVKRFFGISIRTYIKRNREGEAIEGIELPRTVDHGSVPRLRPKLTTKNVKCWHKPLSEDVCEKLLKQHSDDSARVDGIVSQALMPT